MMLWIKTACFLACVALSVHCDIIKSVVPKDELAAQGYLKFKGNSLLDESKQLEPGNFVIKDGFVDGAVAWALFQDHINETGWAYLEVYTSQYYIDRVQAYAAGFVEGHATRDLITMSGKNTYDGYCQTSSAYCQKLQKYLEENFAWVQDQVSAKASSDPYWHQVGLFIQQLVGLTDGYNNLPYGAPHRYKPNMTNLLMQQISGDLEDLETAFKGDQKKHVVGSGSCSALIKVLPNNTDLYVAQDTWSGYNSMLRILKKYDFKYHVINSRSAVIPGQKMTFSSYPGCLLSGDDFYTISSGLVTQETTIGNSNSALWSKITPENSVLEGIRTMVANRLATTGAEWSAIFSRYNSGTYNNQWMVVDYNLFKPGMSQLAPGTLFVLEQIPGMIVYADKTDHLRKESYWPSYNIASDPVIFNASGGREQVAKYGDWFSYDKTPRALIFKRDHSKVTDITSMTKLMRYNDFTKDPLSKCNCTPPYSAENAISARSDLNPANGSYPFGALGHRSHGGIDMKLTSSKLYKSLLFVAISSPAYDNVEPFRWSKSDFGNTTSHVGMPDLWNFGPVTHVWNN